jgi:alpha-1,6-mannosyltransferase
MYTVDAADIYDNIIRGRITAVYGLNPMANTPDDVQTDPFYGFAAPGWHDTSSAYGPVWELLAAFGSRIAGDDPIANVIVFKLISVLSFAITAILIALTLRLVAPRRTLIGFYLFAWNPLVIYMTAGTGHNDAVMAVCVVLGVYLLIRRWYVASTAAMTVGTLIKFIPVLFVPMIAVIAIRNLQGRIRIRYFAASGLICSALVVLAYSPFWHGLDTLSINRRTSMYTGSMATLLRQTISPWLDGLFDGQVGEADQTPNTNNAIKWLVLITFVLLYVDQVDKLYVQPPADDPLFPVRKMLIVLLFYLMVAAIWFQPWYVVWVVPLAALLDNTPTRRLTLFFSYLVTWQSFMYNYVTLRPDGWMALPWRDLLPISITMGLAWAYIVVFWLTTRFRRARRSPSAIEGGQRLLEKREAAGLSIADLADRFDWRSDDLQAYENGDKAVPPNRAEKLNGLLQMPAPETSIDNRFSETNLTP